MMGRQGTNATVGAMHLATGLMSYGVARALQDGIERSRALSAVDRAHIVGQTYLLRRRAEQKLAALAEAERAGQAMLAERKRLHG